MIGVFENRQAADYFSGSKHLTAHRADDVLQAQLVGVGVIALRAGELAQADGGHLEQPAFELARKIGVPFDAADQHDTVALKGAAVHECFDAVGRAAGGDHVQGADHRTAHGGRMNAKVREHIGLAFCRCAAVASHGREDERPASLRFPVVHGRARDGGDVGNAAAADA